MPLDFPTYRHREAAEKVVSLFRKRPETSAVLVVNSCARGVAVPDSDLDMVVIITPEVYVEKRLDLEEYQTKYLMEQVMRAVPKLHLDIVDGIYTPTVWDDGGGPDGFELEIGNHLAYSAPMYERDGYYQELRAKWLPFYSEELRLQRLEMVVAACRSDLDFVSHFLGRDEPFQAFDRLYKAYQEFLQALFLAHRKYPISYNKWIYEQVAAKLSLPELYYQLPGLFEMTRFESFEQAEKAKTIRGWLETYVTQVSLPPLTDTETRPTQ
jgi:predicted nucleotidyltransferase